jgi:hypothetical protein
LFLIRKLVFNLQTVQTKISKKFIVLFLQKINTTEPSFSIRLPWYLHDWCTPPQVERAGPGKLAHGRLHVVHRLAHEDEEDEVRK